MSEPPTKRSKVNVAPRIKASEWEIHKSQLKRLYIDEDKTTKEIGTIMLDEHGFHPTKQQYDKKFTSWKLRKNIELEEWKALSRQLKRYGFTLDDINDQCGKFDVYYNGQHLPFSRVQKAIYRYDTSLLNTDTWFDDRDLSSTDEFCIVLRNLITRCLIRGEPGLPVSRLPMILVNILLGHLNTNEPSSQVDRRDAWTLVTRIRPHRSIVLNGNEQLTFVSSLLLLRNDFSILKPSRNYDKVELPIKFETIVQSSNWWLSWFMPTHMQQNSVVRDFNQVGADILYFSLINCLWEHATDAPAVIKANDVSKILRLPSITTEPHGKYLLNLLLILMSKRGEPALCTQLISGGVNPNIIAPAYISGCRCTILQNFLFLRRVDEIVTLIKAGADPKLCGSHPDVQPHRSLCCSMSPVRLALGQSFTVFSALMDAGACLPEQLDLRVVIQDICDSDVLSALIQKGVDPEGQGCVAPMSLAMCPLQILVALKKNSMALKLLQYVNSPLGCSPTRLAHIPKWQRLLCRIPDLQHHSIFSTPITYAVLCGSLDIANELLERRADLHTSYFDYFSPSTTGYWIENSWFMSMLDLLKNTSVSPLQAAALIGNVTAVQFLLDHGANPNHRHLIGLSPLTIALWNKDQAVVDLLRARGARVLLQDLQRYLKWTDSRMQPQMPEEVLRHRKVIKLYYERIGQDCRDLTLTIPEQYLSDVEALVPQWK